MKKIILSIILTHSMLLASSVQEELVLKNCAESDSLSDIDMLECAITENGLAEMAFASNYRKILDSIKDKKTKEKLIASQEAWVNFKEKDSEFFAASVKNGNMKYVVKLTNMTSMTIKREQEILDSLSPKDVDNKE